MIFPSDVWRAVRGRNRVQPEVFVVKRVDGKHASYPYHLRDLLLAVEIVSPSNTLLDYQIKRDLYLRDGVGEYWVVHPRGAKRFALERRGRPGPRCWARRCAGTRMVRPNRSCSISRRSSRTRSDTRSREMHPRPVGDNALRAGCPV